MKLNRLFKNKASTLLEVVLAMSVLSIAAMFFVSTMTTSSNLIKRGSELSSLSAAAEKNLEISRLSENNDAEEVNVTVKIGEENRVVSVKKIKVQISEKIASGMSYTYYNV